MSAHDDGSGSDDAPKQSRARVRAQLDRLAAQFVDAALSRAIAQDGIVSGEIDSPDPVVEPLVEPTGR